MMLVKYWVWA